MPEDRRPVRQEAPAGAPERGGSLDLAEPRVVHVVGVGGAGMSAIATVLVQMGHRVSGSDLKDSTTLERLALLGVDVHVGHDATNIPADADAVVISTAILATNAEVVEAQARGVPVHRRADALVAIAQTRRTMAVAGSHGKTTTASMLALVLRADNRHPSFVIGGDLNEVGTNAAYDDGEWLVVEADESDGTFLALEPAAALLTNVEADHLDHFGGLVELTESFHTFARGVGGPLVCCADDPVARQIATECSGITYGFSEGARYRGVDYRGGGNGSRMRVVHTTDAGKAELGEIELPVPGRHNALNALGATALALEAGVPFPAAAAALAGFGGVARRFQFRGEADGVTIVDDYAHLPSEVQAAIATAREGCADGTWRRVVVIFQPHRYSRTESLWRDFADAFTLADALVITDVYAAGEPPRPGVSGRLILRSVLDAHPGLAVSYLPRRGDVEAAFARLTRPGDVVLTLGAGDVNTLADTWLTRQAS